MLDYNVRAVYKADVETAISMATKFVDTHEILLLGSRLRCQFIMRYY